MSFNYQSSTKDAYKDRGVAERYHSDFTGSLNWNRLRFRFIAHRERRAVRELLGLVDPKTVVDVRCGTGKLASVLGTGKYQLIAADVSPDMLEIGRSTYSKEGRGHVEFMLCDVETLTPSLAHRNIDLVVCLRLMHRVPREVRARMLKQIATVSRFAIVSFGTDSKFRAWRRKLRHRMFGGGDGGDLCLDTFPNLLGEVAANFNVLGTEWVAPVISDEVVLLLESRLQSPLKSNG